ncbi:MAG TPA: type II toxin-antitoxin system PemK/MazF family toxin [Tepidisphaeraceae bacterium]|nr:type II toxin-antitoxin system PemK/MazF family toxin [Tepidisphaeraceae bacterium]
MKPGDVVLLPVPQIGGGPPKLRPALVLSLLPGAYQNVLICGISTQLHHLEPDWDELVTLGDADFAASGLHRASAIRLSYLCAADSAAIAGSIGAVDPTRLRRLLDRLTPPA